jgi:hypothetical protein
LKKGDLGGFKNLQTEENYGKRYNRVGTARHIIFLELGGGRGRPPYQNKIF